MKRSFYSDFVNLECVAKDSLHIALKVETTHAGNRTVVSGLVRTCMNKFNGEDDVQTKLLNVRTFVDDIPGEEHHQYGERTKLAKIFIRFGYIKNLYIIARMSFETIFLQCVAGTKQVLTNYKGGLRTMYVLCTIFVAKCSHPRFGPSIVYSIQSTIIIELAC